ncbi:hypothetical protein DMENIID0001_109690 [Sergentomyia squamirostris]
MESGTEFEQTVEDIIVASVNLQGNVDRVHVLQWIRKLYQSLAEKQGNRQMVLDYAKYLKLALEEIHGRQITRSYGLFERKPPKGKLPPLSVTLGESLFTKYVDLAAYGDITPIVCQKTADGEGVIMVEKDPSGMISTYMAIQSRQQN